MSNARVSVELPDPLRRFVEDQVESGGFADADAYLRSLVQREHVELSRFRELIQQGQASGPARQLTEADWDELRRQAIRPHA